MQSKTIQKIRTKSSSNPQNPFSFTEQDFFFFFFWALSVPRSILNSRDTDWLRAAGGGGKWNSFPHGVCRLMERDNKLFQRLVCFYRIESDPGGRIYLWYNSGIVREAFLEKMTFIKTWVVSKLWLLSPQAQESARCRNYWSPWARACALPQEKSPQWGAHALQLESSPRSPQLEKALTQQWRSSTAKSKYIHKHNSVYIY